MKRIDTSTVETDKHGTGRDGFTNGNPGLLIPPTQLDDSWHDNVQEELARVVELEGVVLDGSDFEQVSEAVRDGARDLLSDSQGSLASGGGFGSISGLTASLIAPFVYYVGGRRYTVTTAAPGDSPRTFTDNQTTYVYVEPDPSDSEGYIITEQTSPTPAAGTALLGVVTTSAGVITSSQLQTRPIMELVDTEGFRPGDEASDLGQRTNTVSGLDGRMNGVHCKERSLGVNNDGIARDELREIPLVVQTTTGISTVDVPIQISVAQAADDDVGFIKIKVAGKRTDASNFGYAAEKVVGFARQGGAFVFLGAVATLVEVGGGGSTRDVTLVLVGGGSTIQLRHDVTAAEDWRFVTSVEILTNYGT